MNYLMQLVEFNRKPLDRWKLRGFVLATSDKLTLLHLLDDDYYLNGYTVIRNRDVRKHRVFDVPEDFVSRVLRLKDLRPEPQPAISITDWRDTIESANSVFPLVTIHREKINNNVCYIGRVASMKKRTFRLDEIDPKAEWDITRKYRFKDLTRVDFGGGYEDALALVAAEDDERRAQQ